MNLTLSKIRELIRQGRTVTIYDRDEGEPVVITKDPDSPGDYHVLADGRRTSAPFLVSWLAWHDILDDTDKFACSVSQ